MGHRGARVWTVWVLPVAFGAGFGLVRAYARLFRPELLGNPPGWSVGRVLVVNGVHVHHLYVGAALLTGVVGFALVRRRMGVALLASLGIALALIVDEVGLVASGFTEYNHPWTLPLAAATGVALVLVALASRQIRARAP